MRLSDNGESRPSRTTAAVLRRIVKSQGPKHWKAYAVAYGLMLIAAGCTSASAYIVGQVTNIVYSSADFWATIVTCCAVIAIFVVRGVASYGQVVTLATISSSITSEYKILLFQKMLRENLDYFAQKHSSELNNTINFASNSSGNILSALIVATGRDAVTLIGLLAVMVYEAPLPSLACLVIMPTTAISVQRLRNHIRRLSAEQFRNGNAVSMTVQEAFQGLRVVKAFGLESFVMQRYRTSIERLQASSIRLVRISNSSGPLMETMGGIAVALLMMYGAYRVLEQGAQPGEVFSFITAFLLAYEPIKRLARLNVDLAGNMVGLNLLFDILDTTETEADDDDRPALSIVNGTIEARDVEFSYRANEPVLRGLSFTADGGKTLALVGTSGGGKSTILNMLLRFYDPAAGKITIDGQDIQRVSRKSVRRAMTYVGQDIFLFDGTIRENIMVGDPNATEDEIRLAAREANAHDFICRFPEGYDTRVGEQGAQLSTGQRQRIAIARALLRNASIVLLDESTAALDTESEYAVRTAISRVCEGRTTVVIAHRLHTVLDADRILVVEDGMIVEAGSYHELLAKEGRFASLLKLQFDAQAA